MAILKSKLADTEELMVTLLRSMVNTKDWARIAKQYPKWCFINRMKEEQNTHLPKLAKELKTQGFKKVEPNALTKAYEALVIEFSEWYYSHTKSASLRNRTHTDEPQKTSKNRS